MRKIIIALALVAITSSSAFAGGFSAKANVSMSGDRAHATTMPR